MSTCVLRFEEIDRSMLMLAGGKGANLGELSRIKGVRVPDGFCVTTAAYKAVTGHHPELNGLLRELAEVSAAEAEKIREISGKIRTVIEGLPVPANVAAGIAACLAAFGENAAYAVRSSATAEDLPTASFAGQQDTYLNITGHEAVLQHISRCWASLFTERAVVYRIRNGIDHRHVQPAVVVQRMVLPRASGILFTADPVTGNRKVLSIDAGFGLGEALVAGLVNADTYKVKNGQVIDKKIAAKKLAIEALKGGGTRQREIAPEQQCTPVLTEGQIPELARIGTQIAAHFGTPQDVEWCLADDAFYIVQSRPVTTLFPIPVADDNENHVYISVGHQQMMTDAMLPLGLSFYLLMTPAPMRAAGGRLFVDVTRMLATPVGRKNLLGTAGKSDPLVKDALETVIARGDFIPSLPDDAAGKNQRKMPALDAQAPVSIDPAIVAGLMEHSEAMVNTLQRNIETKHGPAVLDFIREHMQQQKQETFESQTMSAILTSMNASLWLNEKMEAWLGEKNVADTLAQSVPGNVTSEMGLALLDVADAIRPYPAVIGYLQQAHAADFRDELLRLEGGREAWNAIDGFLLRYGMRCAGEIDITRTRWREQPAALAPLILSNTRNFAPQESRRRFEQGLQEALKKEEELLRGVRQLPDGEQKARETKRVIDLLRSFAGYREYPKYAIVSRFFIYRQALLKEAEALLQAGVIREKEDVYYLWFEELQEAIRTRTVDAGLIAQRKEAYKLYEKLTPPRVITSDGEIIAGSYRRGNLPAGAIVGLPVSAGVIEGRARVILNIAEANLEEGDILVTAFTDPCWTPLFVSIKGLVTEVGGLMTHGAVIAREYGLPAVVGVEGAATLIKDGQRIRVNGTDGYVEIL